MSEEAKEAVQDDTQAALAEDARQDEIADTLFDKTAESEDEQAPNDESEESADEEQKDEKEDEESSDESDEESKEESDEKESEEKSEDDKEEDYKLEVSEDSKLSGDDVEEIESYAKDQGFSKAQAEKILEFQEKAYAQAQKNSEDDLSDLKVQWESDSKADKEIGGDNLGKSVESAKRALDRFATEEFKEILNKTGFGNHPEVVRAWSRVGLAMSDDKVVLDGATPTQPRKIEDIFYGKNQGE